MVTRDNASNEGLSRMCRDVRGWITLKCPHGNLGHYPIRCGKCDGCKRSKVGRAVARIIAGLETAPPESVGLLTLTTLPDTPWPVIMRRFQSFIKWLRNTQPEVQYVAIKERGRRSGMFHLHVLLIGWRYVPWGQLMSAWRKRTGARGVDIRRVSVDQAKVIGYVSKYIAKGLADGCGARRAVTFSGKWPRLAERADFTAVGTDGQVYMRPWRVTTHGFLVAPGGRPELELCDCYGEVGLLDMCPTLAGEGTSFFELTFAHPP